MLLGASFLGLGCIFLQESSGFLRFPFLWHFFHRNHNSCSAVTFSEHHQETCLYGAYVGSYAGYQFVRQKQSTMQFYGTLRWLLSTPIAALPPPLLCRHCCTATTTATPIAAPPLLLPLLRCLSRCCTVIAIAAPPMPLLHRHCCCCTAIAVTEPLSPLLHHHLLCHCCAHCCPAIAALPRQRQEMATMETTMARTINDDSNNKGNADNNGDNGNDHNGNNNEATTIRPQQQGHDNDTTKRYNNQLNGGPSAVDCNDDNDNNGNSDGDSNGNSNGNGKGDGDGEGDGGSTRCNDNDDDNNNNPLPIILDVVVVLRLCLCRTVTMTAVAGRQGGSCCWQGGEGNSDSACCNNDNTDHDNNHPLPVIVDVFIIGCLSLCGARLTTAVGWQRGSGCQQGREDSGRQGQTQWCHSLQGQQQPSLPCRHGRCHHLAPLSLQQWNDDGCSGTAARGQGQEQWTPQSSCGGERKLN
jgi:hypothetical protein